MKVNRKRVFTLNKKKVIEGPVIYWMSRDQRIEDNWALLYAQEIAEKEKKDLMVVFFLSSNFLNATIRQYDFMIKGLMEVEEKLQRKNIPFFVFLGEPKVEIEKVDPGVLITDFDPLKIKRKWKREVNKKIDCAFFEVDAHNIVPCRYVSSKQEFAAYTIRPKINKMLTEFLTEFPKVKKQKESKYQKKINWKKLYKSLEVDITVEPVDWIFPGEKAGKRVVKDFVERKLEYYNEDRNNPELNGQSDLSPYLHFGQISSQRVVLEVEKSGKKAEEFLEEIIVRKELSDNFCFYNQNYDSVKGFPDWAKKTVEEHKNDKREYLYSRKKLENGETYDELWNSAQKEMVETGKMHGYMRMYWAKKILEWTASASKAIQIAIYLNDKYELDGRDSNGYTGIAWSIGGVHDRAWGERPVFGKIRYMSYKGSRSKFNIENYIEKVEKEGRIKK